MDTAEHRMMNQAGDLGSAALMQYWNDLLAVYMASYQRFGAVYSAYWQRVVAGNLTPDELRTLQQEYVREVWNDYLVLARFPYEWFSRWNGAVPEVVFYVDSYMETTPPELVTLSAVVDGLAVHVTDLQLITHGAAPVRAGVSAVQPGAASIPSSHVQVEVLAEGTRARVSLIELLARPKMPGEAGATTTVEVPEYMFQYVGGAYAQEGQTRRPLFNIRVFLMPLCAAGVRTSTAPAATT